MNRLQQALSVLVNGQPKTQQLAPPPARKQLPRQNRPQMRTSYMVGQAVPPQPKAEDQLKAYTRWVYACVRAIAEETADIQLKLQRRVDQTEFEAVDEHPVLDLLYKVNPIYTSYLMWEATQSYIELTGECFWMLLGPINAPKEIWVLRPDWVKILDDSKNLIRGYSYGPPGDKAIFIPYEAVIHFKDFNPLNPYRGYGVIKAGAQTIDTDNFAAEYNRLFFYNSAIPAGALSTEQGLTEEQYERIKEEWKTSHQGLKKAWQVAILEAGLKWEDIGMNRKEMDFGDGKRMTRDEIISMFRVPKTILMITDDVNRATSREARYVFLENVITHKMKRLVSFMNEFLLPRYGDDSLFFDYKNPVPNDQTAQLAFYDNSLRHGWLTRNEVRELENRDPVDGGDQLLVPFGLAPIGALGQEEQQEQAKKMRFKTFNVRIPTFPFQKAQLRDIHKKLEQTAEKMIRALMVQRQANIDRTKDLSTSNAQEAEVVPEPTPEEVEAKKKEEEADEIRWRAMVKRTDADEVRYIKALANQFNDQEAKVLQQVDLNYEKTLKNAVTKDNNDILSPLDDLNVFSAPLMDIIRDIIQATGIIEIQSLVDGAIFYLQSKAVQAYLKKDGLKYLDAVNKETRELLQDQLSVAVANGESIPQVKARIEAVYDQARGYRAERIARSEVLRATNFATEQAYVQSKVVEAKEWLTAEDERVCPFCGPADGKIVDLKKVFYKKGQTISGKNESGKKVTMTINLDDVSHPPLHPNCRCTLKPIVIEEE